MSRPSPHELTKYAEIFIPKGQRKNDSPEQKLSRAIGEALESYVKGSGNNKTVTLPASITMDQLKEIVTEVQGMTFETKGSLADAVKAALDEKLDAKHAENEKGGVEVVETDPAAPADPLAHLQPTDYLRPDDFRAYGEALVTEENKKNYVNPLADIKQRLMLAEQCVTEYDARFPIRMTKGDLEITMQQVNAAITEKRNAKPTPTDDTVRTHANTTFTHLLNTQRMTEQALHLDRDLLGTYSMTSGILPKDYDKTTKHHIRHTIFTFLKGASQTDKDFADIIPQNFTLGQLEKMVAACETEMLPQEQYIAQNNTKTDNTGVVFSSSLDARVQDRFLQHLKAFPKEPEKFVSNILPTPAPQNQTHTGTAAEIADAMAARAKEKYPDAKDIVKHLPGAGHLEELFGEATTLRITDAAIDAMLTAIEKEEKIAAQETDRTRNYTFSNHPFGTKAPYIAGMRAFGTVAKKVVETQQSGQSYEVEQELGDSEKIRDYLLKSHREALGDQETTFVVSVAKEPAVAAMDRIYDELGAGLDRYNAIIAEEVEKHKQAEAARVAAEPAAPEALEALAAPPPPAATAAEESAETPPVTGESAAQPDTGKKDPDPDATKKDEPEKIKIGAMKVTKTQLGVMGGVLAAVGIYLGLTAKEKVQEEGKEEPTEKLSGWKVIVGGLASAAAVVAGVYLWRNRVSGAKTQGQPIAVRE